jgi:hypothetical protein
LPLAGKAGRGRAGGPPATSSSSSGWSLNPSTATGMSAAPTRPL